jgi:hypothetical protein
MQLKGQHAAFIRHLCPPRRVRQWRQKRRVCYLYLDLQWSECFKASSTTTREVSNAERNLAGPNRDVPDAHVLANMADVQGRNTLTDTTQSLSARNLQPARRE